MRIALVHDFLLRLGGAERVLKSLSDLFPSAPIYTLLYNEKTTGSIFPPEKVHPSPLQNHPLTRLKPQLLLKHFPTAIESFDLNSYDLILTSSSAFAKSVLTPPETPVVTYCHRPLGYAWDYVNEYPHEKKFGPLRRALTRRALHSLRLWDRTSANRTTHWIANSRTTVARLRKYYRTPSTLIYPPVNTHLYQASPNHKNYFLILSSLQSFKRIDLAIKAFNKLKEELIIIGDGPESKNLKHLAGPTVHLLGRKSDSEIKIYLENCRAFIFPGEEDFGIAPVEAMSCGKPVLAYRRGGLTETVLGGRTGEFFNDPTPQSLINGFTRLLISEPNYNPEIIRQHAEKFSEKTFQQNIQKFLSNLSLPVTSCHATPSTNSQTEPSYAPPPASPTS